jgi:hypothetical protein
MNDEERQEQGVLDRAADMLEMPDFVGAVLDTAGAVVEGVAAVVEWIAS